MKRLPVIVTLILLTGVIVQAQIISQYIETSSETTPKGIEIWNNTGGTLDFSTNNLVIEKGTNGDAPSTDYTLSSGTLTSGSSLVIGTSDLQATTEGNSSDFFTKAFSYNGNDALVVKYGGTTTDVFGDPGTGDPGTGWSGSGVQSYNQNIALKSGISTGDTDGWTDPSTRFEVISTDNTMTGFGLSPGATDTTPPTWTSTFPKGQSETASGFDVAINLDEIGTAYFVVLADGASAPSSAQVKAGTDASDGAVASTSKGTISALAASTQYTGSASSLSASTAYDVYVVAEDDEGSPNIQASPTKIDVSTTVAASAPAASTSAASSVDHESATLNGSVTANNASTTVTFEYGLTTGYGSTATAAESPVTGSSGTSVSASVSSLSASTTYHFRVKAVNSEGTTYGSDETLTTSAALPNIVINEFQADPDATNGDANGDGSVNTSEDEFVEFVNRSGSTVDISGWVISDGVSDRHTVPGSTSLPDGVALVVFGGGSPTGIPGVVQTASTGSLGLNNSGDGITLKNSSGTTIVTYTYGSEAGDNQAVARDPDYTGSFVKHLTITGNAVRFSPGKTNSADQSLPVELSVWKATSSQGMIKLFWTTDSEVENQGFIIERSGGHQDKTWNEIASFTTSSDLLGQGSTTAQNDYTFIDKQVKVGKSYSYRLADVDYQGVLTRHPEIKVTVKDAGTNVKPSDVKLHKAFPNPFNPDVNLSYTLETEVEALSLEIYDIKGALIQTLSSGYHEMGTHDLRWNGYDSHDNTVSSGVYLVRLSAGSVVQIQRVTLLR